MRCSDIAPFLYDVADATADARGQRIVERHTALCPACHAEIKQARQVAQQVERLPLLPHAVALRVPRMERRLAQRRTTHSHALRSHPWVAVLVVLCVALEAVLMWLMFALR